MTADNEDTVTFTIPRNDFRPPKVRPKKLEMAAKALSVLLNGETGCDVAAFCTNGLQLARLRKFKAERQNIGARDVVNIAPNESYCGWTEIQNPIYDCLSYLNVAETRELARMFGEAGYHIYFPHSWRSGTRPVYVSKADEDTLRSRMDDVYEIGVGSIKF